MARARTSSASPADRSAGIGPGTEVLVRAEGADLIITAPKPGSPAQAGGDLGASIAATGLDQLEQFSDELATPIDHVTVTGPGP
jgi:hypothetical protein